MSNVVLRLLKLSANCRRNAAMSSPASCYAWQSRIPIRSRLIPPTCPQSSKGSSSSSGAPSHGAHVNVSADRLRSPSLTAVITNGRLSAAFAVPPQQVSIALTSAQAALRLPGHAAYRINQQVVSGYIHATIPQESGATRTVTARLRSSELELLAS